MVEEIEARANNKYAVQDIVMRRVEYTAYQQELRKKKDEKEDAERRKFLDHWCKISMQNVGFRLIQYTHVLILLFLDV